MQILTLLEEKREILIKEWAKLVFATYPAETQKISKPCWRDNNGTY